MSWLDTSYLVLPSDDDSVRVETCSQIYLTNIDVLDVLEFDFVAFHTVVLSISIYCGPSNTTLYYQRCLIQQLTGRHVSVSR